MGRQLLDVVVVCTHNRTRSVMVDALLADRLGARLGSDRIRVRSFGFVADGLQPTPESVRAMQRRGLDVSGHRSRVATTERIGDPTVVLAMERDHVVRLAAMEPAWFERTFTLPEFVERPDASASERMEDETDVRDRVALLGVSRQPFDYLRSPVPEVADPTGWSRRRFDRAVDDLDELTAVAARRLAALVERSDHGTVRWM